MFVTLATSAGLVRTHAPINHAAKLQENLQLNQQLLLQANQGVIYQRCNIIITFKFDIAYEKIEECSPEQVTSRVKRTSC